MATSDSSNNLGDSPVFDDKTLRLIVGALAFAFPLAAVVLSGKVTTSISASYWEPKARDVFVGFLFLIGGLLISYKGHVQGKPRQPSEKLLPWILSFKWLKVYQEDAVSTLGGAAAIFTALYPTSCDGCPIDRRAIIHMSGAFILFSTVVYFCFIAFLRSLNRKLLAKLLPPSKLTQGTEFGGAIETIRKNKTQVDVNLFLQFWNFLTLEAQTFLATTKVQLDNLNAESTSDDDVKKLEECKVEIKRGRIYVICGSVIIVTLVAYIILSVTMPTVVAKSTITFVTEMIALVFFGIAWMTASKIIAFLK